MLTKFIFRHTYYKKLKGDDLERYFALAYPRDKICFDIRVFLIDVILMCMCLICIFFFNGSLLVLLGFVSVFVIFYNSFKKMKGTMNAKILHWSSKIFFEMKMLNGDAITPDDYSVLAEKNLKQFGYIFYGMCRGLCYGTCFEILKALKKGKIQFVEISPFANEHIPKRYTMHVLYVNNGWAFDTFSQLQYKLEDIYKIFDAGKIWKEFTYEDIKYISYYTFKAQNLDDMKQWCAENDCHQQW